MSPSLQKRLKSAFRTTTLLRARDLAALGFSRAQMREAVSTQHLEQAGRGLYRMPRGSITQHHSLAEIGRRVPSGVVCLLSALSFHGLTTQSSHEIWLAVGHKAWSPRSDNIPLRIVRFSGASLKEGVETHTVEGVPIKIYSPGKTVADCFKFRNKIGLDVALEALRETWASRRTSMKELQHFARIDRVAKVMQPYLESLT